MAEDYRKLRGWILENAGLEAKSLPIAIRILWMMDRERWEAYQREHTPNSLEEGLELILSYLKAAITTTAAQVAGPPAEGELELVLSYLEAAINATAAQVAGPPAEEYLLSPSPTAEGECLLSPSPPAEGKCLLSPYPPAEGKCLLVLPPEPKWEEPERPQPKWEEPEHPQPKWEEPERPQPKGESVRPQPKEGGVGACTALGPKQPAEGECLLVPPPLLPPQEPEGGELQAQPPEIFWGGEGQDAGVPQQPLFLLLKAARQAPPPENFWGGEGQDAGVPQQPLFMLLKAARRAPAQPPQRREPAPPGAEELELPLLPEPPPQGGRWPEPQKGELPATKKGEEVWRPLSPAAVSLQEFLWLEPHKGELPAMKKGEVGGPPAPAAFSLQDGTSMLSAVPLPAGVLTAWPAMGPLKPPFPARDYVLDCWIFKGGGGR
ncbi:UNVERIFIED_CONTAM: hypothetical protein FKN15_074784 [Acipenser sinensis]